jgi:hypothetical protein
MFTGEYPTLPLVETRVPIEGYGSVPHAREPIGIRRQLAHEPPAESNRIDSIVLRLDGCFRKQRVEQATTRFGAPPHIQVGQEHVQMKARTEARRSLDFQQQFVDVPLLGRTPESNL